METTNIPCIPFQNKTEMIALLTELESLQYKIVNNISFRDYIQATHLYNSGYIIIEPDGLCFSDSLPADFEDNMILYEYEHIDFWAWCKKSLYNLSFSIGCLQYDIEEKTKVNANFTDTPEYETLSQQIKLLILRQEYLTNIEN